MINLLQHSRRPDISFNRNGVIRITARVVRALSICPGDALNIALDNGEYLLYATNFSNKIGQLEAQCYPTKKGSKNFCANSVRLCRGLFDSIGITTHKASFMIGEAFKRGDIIYAPIITHRPL